MVEAGGHGNADYVQMFNVCVCSFRRPYNNSALRWMGDTTFESNRLAGIFVFHYGSDRLPTILLRITAGYCKPVKTFLV